MARFVNSLTHLLSAIEKAIRFPIAFSTVYLYIIISLFRFFSVMHL